MSSNQASCCSATNESRASTDSFTRTVGEISGNCQVGEDWATTAMNAGKIPVLSCEGPCIKGEIARRSATLVPRLDSRFERACHGEAFYVPYSSMAKWVANADSVLMIDGCFLSCHGRVLSNLIDSKKIIHVNAHSIHKEYGDTFSYDDIPDSELSELAEQVAKEVVLL